MDFKSMLQQLSQLSEATTKTKTGVKHTAEPGGYGRKFDTDEEGDEKKDTKKEPAAKRGRGRPKKGADDSGEVKKYDNAKNLQSFMIGNVPKKSKDLEKLPKKKHSLKEWVQEIEEKYVAETAPGQQLTVKPMPGAAQLVDPATQKVMATGDAAAVKNIQGAVAQGKVQMRGAGAQEMAEEGGDYSAKKARAGKDIGKPGKQFSKIAKSAAERYGSKERGEKVAGAVLAKLRKGVNEVEQPTMDNQTAMGAGLGAGRSQTTLESRAKADDKAEKAGKKVTKDLEYDMGHKGKDDAKAEKAGKKVTKDIEYDEKKKKAVKEAAKPDYIDLDKDGNKKETMKKAASDKKKKVNESMHKHSAARLLGKAHALAKEGYNCKFEDMEEAKCYHDGYKEGLDECYGQGVYEMAPATPPATPGGMASQAMPAMEDDMDEGNAFTAALARTPKGGKFSLGGKTFTDRTGYDSKTFESLETQLNALLESEKVEEGMSVSISKGQQGSPDSVSVTAQDGEAEQLLSLIKQAGLGLFGGEESNGYGAPQGSDVTNAHGDIDVVGDHDGMMSLIKKVTGHGGEQGGSEDYADEEGHDHEETCETCGESACKCDEEVVDEVESYDQEEEEVAEDNPPDSGAAETTSDENAEAAEDAALAKSDAKADTVTTNEGGDGGEASEEGEEEQVTEWANDAGENAKDFDDEQFKTDMDFMTKVISGGLNKQKSTGQTTIPVIAGQDSRMVTRESVNDWKKLAGIR